jgi:hypothetical protein
VPVDDVHILNQNITKLEDENNKYFHTSRKNESISSNEREKSMDESYCMTIARGADKFPGLLMSNFGPATLVGIKNWVGVLCRSLQFCSRQIIKVLGEYGNLEVSQQGFRSRWSMGS